MGVPTSSLIARYQRLSTPVVYDVLDHLGFPNQALSADIRPLAPQMMVVGPIFTIEEGDYLPGETADVSAFQMFRDLVPGSVLVMATNGHRVSGPWGENTSLSALAHGARGIIIDGGTRDANAIVALGFPTFCRYVTPVYASRRCEVRAYQQPISLAGQVGEAVVVRPGDFAVADRDGVVVVPKALIEEVLIAAERLEEIEEQIRAGLKAGEDREDVYRCHPKFDHIQKRLQP